MSGEEFAEGPLENGFISQSCFQARHSSEPLIPAHLGSALHTQKKGDVVLRQAQALSMGSQVIWEMKHVV